MTRFAVYPPPTGISLADALRVVLAENLPHEAACALVDALKLDNDALRALVDAPDDYEVVRGDGGFAETPGTALVTAFSPGWFACDGNVEVYYRDAASGAEAAGEFVEDGDWSSGDDEVGRATFWHSVCVWRAAIVLTSCGDVETMRIDEDTHDIEVDAVAPPCEPLDGAPGHVWASPYAVLGGLRENPGVVGHGGGVIIREVCARCGCYRETDTWAQDPATGRQGLTAVSFRIADDDSIAWVEAGAEED